MGNQFLFHNKVVTTRKMGRLISVNYFLEFCYFKKKLLLQYLLDTGQDRCQIPSYAHTLVGVGGMVINER